MNHLGKSNLNDKLNKNLIIKNRIKIVSGNKIKKNEQLMQLKNNSTYDKNLNNLDSLKINSNSNHNRNYDHNHNLNLKVNHHHLNRTNNHINKKDMTLAIEEADNEGNYLYKDCEIFNDNLNFNNNGLDSLNSTTSILNLSSSFEKKFSKRSQVKSTSFESNLTDDCTTNSENSTDFGLNVDSNSNSSNLEEDDVDEDDSEFNNQAPIETDKLLEVDNRKTDQKIVEVLRQLVRDCTNPDPTKRPSAYELSERLQPFTLGIRTLKK